jgi:hypothetical protein
MTATARLSRSPPTRSLSYKLGGSLLESGTRYVLAMDGCQDVVETSCPMRAPGT